MNCPHCGWKAGASGECPQCGKLVSVIAKVDLGKLKPPVAEKLSRPWTFRAACRFKEPEVAESRLVFGLILDLGFGIYRQISGVLDGVEIVDSMADLAVSFAANWARNGVPNDLEAHTVGRAWGTIWSIDVRRAELHGETLQVEGFESLADALIKQGLAKKLDDGKDWPEA